MALDAAEGMIKLDFSTRGAGKEIFNHSLLDDGEVNDRVKGKVITQEHEGSEKYEQDGEWESAFHC